MKFAECLIHISKDYILNTAADMIIETFNITPQRAFLALRHLQMPFIFPGGASRRHSIVSASPLEVIKTDGRAADPFTALSETAARYSRKSKGPFPFNSGAVGYFSYDLKDVIEPKVFKERGKKGIGIPASIIGIYDPVFIYDHAEEKGYLVSTGGLKERVEEFRKAFNNAPEGLPERLSMACAGFSSNFTKEGYLNAINRAKDYISSGDIYQINLSQRLTIPWKGDAFSLFASLTENYPMPFGSFIDYGEFQIISNSPERLLKIADGIVETSPIKGTRPRGKDPEEDSFFIEELKKSKKERAEHVMIVDLERNDLGRISVPGSVNVTEFEEAYTYPGLHHMISTVRGILKEGIDSPSALRSVFPGGSVTGAPKIRAMEIIDELEPDKRDIYTGAVGWMDFNGEMDFSMAIRTAVSKDGLLYLNVGGGIVADSVPEDEYVETLIKAKDFLSTLGIEVKV